MEEKEVNKYSKDQFIITFQSNYILNATRLKCDNKRETRGRWQLIKEEQGPKLYL